MSADAPVLCAPREVGGIQELREMIHLVIVAVEHGIEVSILGSMALEAAQCHVPFGPCMTAAEWPQYLGRDSSAKHDSIGLAKIQ